MPKMSCSSVRRREREGQGTRHAGQDTITSSRIERSTRWKLSCTALSWFARNTTMRPKSCGRG